MKIGTGPNWIWLSHFLNERTPVYGNGPGFSRKQKKSIQQGDSSNTQEWTFLNHLGTHIDFPFHCIESGKKMENYPIQSWHFKRIAVISCKLPSTDSCIRIQHCVGKIKKNTELVLFKTGFEKYRHQKKYWENNPGIHPEVANWLRVNAPFVRAIGMDFLSVSAWKNRERGRAAHKAFLGTERQKEVLLIEDMHLKKANQKLSEVWVLPLRVSCTDGAPCTIIGQQV